MKDSITHLNVVGSVVQETENDRQHFFAVIQNFGLAVLGELAQAEARALPNVRAGVKRQLHHTGIGAGGGQ